jgi:hypothetical protein
MGNRDPLKKQHTPPSNTRDEDEDDEDEDVDDREIADLERVRTESPVGCEWTLVSETDESMTYIMQLPTGCLVRVKAWGLGGEPMMSVVFAPGVSLGDFVREPAISPEDRMRLLALFEQPKGAPPSDAPPAAEG